MSAPEYVPTHGTLAERVVEWLRHYPKSELTISQIATRFDVRQTEVAAALWPAVQRGELVRLVGIAGYHGCVYALGDGEPLEAQHAPQQLVEAQDAGDNPTDISVAVKRDGHLSVSFLLPPHADPHRVAAAMLAAAACSMEQIKVVPLRKQP